MNLFFKNYKLIIYGLIIIILGCEKNEQNATQNLVIESKKKDQILDIIYSQQTTLNLCNQERDQKLSKNSANIYLLSEKYYLIEILCFLGAYQSNYQYLFFNEKSKEIKVVNFITFDNTTENLKLTNTNTLTGMAEFDPIHQNLILETKTRGLGDCGSFAKYNFHKSSFELKEYRHKKDCDGVYIPPEDYPIIYP